MLDIFYNLVKHLNLITSVKLIGIVRRKLIVKRYSAFYVLNGFAYKV
jgi:hypothetical protein